jgi:O-antigen/teichoic acid export membrane protein
VAVKLRYYEQPLSDGVLQFEPTTSATPAGAQGVAVQVSLTHRTARGFAWLMVDTFGSKVVNVVGQIALARLLLPEHWGLVGLAYTVAAFADVASNAGLREVLIQRHNRFKRWANAATWMSVALGMISGLLMVLATPLATWFYNSPQLPPLMLVMAATLPVWSLGSVPEALLRSQLRFRAVSVINLVRSGGIMALSVAFAWLGWGAFSFVVPRAIMGLGITLLLWGLALRIERRTSDDECRSYPVAHKSLVRWNPQFRRWRYLIGDTGLLLLATLLLSVIAQGGYIVLGRFHTDEAVGMYFFAYNLSLQTVVLFGLNLANVLLPALSKLQENQARLLSAFLRAARLLAAIGVPLCLLQAAVAAPAIRAVFSAKWVPAIPILQVLSISMAWMMTWNISKSLLQAQGRFMTHLIVIGVYAVCFLGAVTVAAMTSGAGADGYAGARAVAIATAIFFSIAGPVDLYIALQGAGGGWRDVWRVYAAPWALSAVTVGPVVWLVNQTPSMPGRDWILLLAIPTVSLALYALAMRRFTPAIWNDILERARGATLK